MLALIINFVTLQMMETLTCTWEKALLEIVKVNKIKSRLNGTIVFFAIARHKQLLLKGTAKWQMANENNNPGDSRK